MFSNDEMVTEIEKLDWQAPNPALLANNFDLSSGQLPILFRGHDILSPHSLPDSNREHIIHATPHFDVATSIWKFKLERNYSNVPPNIAFVSTYVATPKQKFYRDEHLEAVVQRRIEDCGMPLEAIRVFDPVQHFETCIDLAANRLLAIYMYRWRGLGQNKQIALLPNGAKLYGMLETNAKTVHATSANDARRPLESGRYPPIGSVEIT